MRATYLVAEVHALLGLGPSATALATRALTWFESVDAPDWERAYLHVIHAHAAAAAGIPLRTPHPMRRRKSLSTTSPTRPIAASWSRPSFRFRARVGSAYASDERDLAIRSTCRENPSIDGIPVSPARFSPILGLEGRR